MLRNTEKTKLKDAKLEVLGNMNYGKNTRFLYR